MDLEKPFYLKAEKEGSVVNRCTVYGTNAILGNCYFLNLRQFFKNCAGRKSFEEVIAEFARTNQIPLPIKTPFAVVQHQNKPYNVTFVPKA